MSKPVFVTPGSRIWLFTVPLLIVSTNAIKQVLGNDKLKVIADVELSLYPHCGYCPKINTK